MVSVRRGTWAPRMWAPLCDGSRAAGALLFVAILLVTAGTVGAATAAVPVPVVTSTTVFADFVSNVGGDRVRVRSLAPAGTDPHTFQPTPDSMRHLAEARAIFFNGAGLEEWWDKTVRSVKKPGVPIVELSTGLATIKMSDHGHAEGPDPHVWLDPTLAKIYVDRIRETLVRVDADGATTYREGARAFQARLDGLDGWIRGQIDSVPVERRKMVTFHPAFQYFAHRYGLAVKGFIVASPAKEPSAKALAELTQLIKRERVPAVFAEADFNSKMLEVLAKDAGVAVVTNLYDDSLSSGPPAATYITMMRHNVAEIVNALK